MCEFPEAVSGEGKVFFFFFKVENSRTHFVRLIYFKPVGKIIARLKCVKEINWLLDHPKTCRVQFPGETIVAALNLFFQMHHCLMKKFTVTILFFSFGSCFFFYLNSRL